MVRSKITLYVGAVAIAVGAAAMLASCHKNKDTASTTNNTTEETGYATEHAVAEKAYNDVESIADQAAAMPSGGSLSYKTTGITSACATVTRTTGSIIVDFGVTNCMCNDGRNRRGRILISYTGNYSDSASVRTITFDNYYQNDNNIAGTKTVTNMGHNSLGQPYFNVNINGTITLASGGTISTNWTRVRTWTDGYTTLGVFSDDKYAITGSGTLTRASGAVVNLAIAPATPLVIAAGCRWIEAGTLTATMPSGLTRSLNYGSTAACDNDAVLTLPSGATYNITLP